MNQYLQDIAKKCGFRPYESLSEEETNNLQKYIEFWYPGGIDPNRRYWWKESEAGDNNWISFDVVSE